MATANEVLEQMEQHPELYVSADVCIVDPVTRTISVPDAYRILGVESDESVKVVPFQCPKMVEDDVDLTDFTLYINYVNAGGDFGIYSIENVKESGENITFDWIIRRSVTARRGTIRFILCAKRSDDEGNIIQEWNTTINDECESLEGLEGAPSIADQYPDIIQQILEKLQEITGGGGGGTGGTTNYNNLSNKPQLNGVTLEGNKTLDQVGVLAKNQGASNSGKYLSVGSDGNVVPADAPSGGEGGGGITEETDPTVPAWAKEPTKPTYTAVEVGADASGTAEAKVSVHNTAVDAHSDIRLLVQELTTRLNALADSDDDTLDQMSEIVAYIKSNKSLIDAITTQKVSVTDIIDNLTTNVANKPLSAAQGVALKALIDGITIPETLPNPQKIIFTGAVTAEYDGSSQQTINIPTGGSDPYTLPIMSSAQLGGGKAIEKTDEDVPVAVDPSTGQLFVPTYPESGSGASGITVSYDAEQQAIVFTNSSGMGN